MTRIRRWRAPTGRGETRAAGLQRRRSRCWRSRKHSALPDRPPPSRFAVIERGGRLVIVDRTTGKTPPSAAERMAEHDRRMGLVAAKRPETVVPAPAAIEIGRDASPARRWQDVYIP